MAEYLERQAVIDAIYNHADEVLASHHLPMTADIYRMAHRHIIEVVERLQAAEVAPVHHGRWERASYDEAICSECGFDGWTGFLSSQEADEKWRYLPPYCERCGARMEWTPTTWEPNIGDVVRFQYTKGIIVGLESHNDAFPVNILLSDGTCHYVSVSEITPTGDRVDVSEIFEKLGDKSD